MTSKKDQQIKELQDLLAASRAQVVLLNNYAYRLRAVLDEIANIAGDI